MSETNQIDAIRIGDTYGPFLGIKDGQNFKAVRRLSESEATAYETAARRLRVYEREAFPFACAIQSFHELRAARERYAAGGAWIGNLRASSQISLHLNRLIMNYLSSFRAFLDHAETRFKRTFGGDSDAFRDLKQTQKLHYDNSFSYRFVYNLRNYAQHCGLPMGNLEYQEDEENETKTKKLSISFVRDQLLDGFDDWRGNLRACLPEIRRTQALPVASPPGPSAGSAATEGWR